MDRRGFIGSILALGMAPAVVRASHIMPIRTLEESPIFIAKFGDLISTEALRLSDLILELQPIDIFSLYGYRQLTLPLFGYHEWTIDAATRESP